MKLDDRATAFSPSVSIDGTSPTCSQNERRVSRLPFHLSFVAASSPFHSRRFTFIRPYPASCGRGSLCLASRTPCPPIFRRPRFFPSQLYSAPRLERRLGLSALPKQKDSGPFTSGCCKQEGTSGLDGGRALKDTFTKRRGSWVTGLLAFDFKRQEAADKRKRFVISWQPEEGLERRLAFSGIAMGN